MAKVIKADKPFLLIECTAKELMDAVGSYAAMCDWCANAFLGTDEGVYIAVLNRWFCKECYEEWIERSDYIPEDADIERKNFEFYAPRFGINPNSTPS